MAIEARDRRLPDWLTKIRTRQLVLPRFQRLEAWSHTQITDLFNTVLRELPAGAVLILEVGDKEKFISRPIVGAPESGEKISEQLLDGQQRLTALWRALCDNYEDRIYMIEIRSDEDSESPPYSATSFARYKKNGKKYPMWIDNPQEIWARKYFPVSILSPNPDGEKRFGEWAKLAANGDSETLIQLIQLGNTLRNKFATFNIPFLSLPIETPPEVALDVFIKMNTGASPLKPYDIVVAQVEAATNNSMHEYMNELKQEIPNLTRYEDPGDAVLAVAALLQDKMPSKSTYLQKDFSENFENNWENLKRGLQNAIKFLSEEKIFDSKRLPTDVIISVISALWTTVPAGLDREGRLRTIARKYMWRAFFTSRYDKNTNSRSFSDFKELRKLIACQNGEPEIFKDEIYSIPNIEELAIATWPSRKDRLSRAILAVSLKFGGFDFADGSPATYENLLNREYHHIFPYAWLTANNLKDHEINIAINCAFISWKTNRNISAKTPSDYVAERMDKSSLGDSEVKQRLASHLIPYNELVTNDYKSFVQKRAEMIYNIAKRLINGENI